MIVMERVLPKEYYPFDLNRDRSMLMLLGKVLNEYRDKGKSIEQFEEDYGCRLTFNEFEDLGAGITGVLFHSDSNETAFVLKYKL